MKIVVTRLSNLYGPGDDCDSSTAHLVGNTIRKVALGEAPEIWGDGVQLRAYLYVTEALEGILSLMEREENLGPVNMGRSARDFVKEVVEHIIQISGKPIQIHFHPEGPTGLSRKILDIGQLTRLIEFQESIPLEEGLPHVAVVSIPDVGRRSGIRMSLQWIIKYNFQFDGEIMSRKNPWKTLSSKIVHSQPFGSSYAMIK